MLSEKILKLWWVCNELVFAFQFPFSFQFILWLAWTLEFWKGCSSELSYILIIFSSWYFGQVRHLGSTTCLPDMFTYYDRSHCNLVENDVSLIVCTSACSIQYVICVFRHMIRRLVDIGLYILHPRDGDASNMSFVGAVYNYVCSVKEFFPNK